jgi:hypothetical protein
MLPLEPKIFHGRQSEIEDILELFRQGTPRVAILGAGEMRKTSLARALIHHAEITGKYSQNRFFITCDSAATQVELAALIGAHLELKPGKDLTHPVIQHFSRTPDSLLILDNLETLWEPADSRSPIEEFLSLLTGVDHLALLVSPPDNFQADINSYQLDYNARSRKASQSSVDTAISTAFKTLGTKCSSPNLY